jgi:hypothetical protein
MSMMLLEIWKFFVLKKLKMAEVLKMTELFLTAENPILTVYFICLLINRVLPSFKLG